MNTTFEGIAWFTRTTFKRDVGFSHTFFKRDVGFSHTFFKRHAMFYGATFEGDAQFSGGSAKFYSATFKGDLRLEGRMGIELAEADFAESSMLRAQPREGHEDSTPRILTLLRAKVAGLTISGADLRSCLFEGARGLDQMRLERVSFAKTPSGRRRWQWKRWRLPIRWTRRQAIAEEHAWRADQLQGRASNGEHVTGWCGSEVQATGLDPHSRKPPGPEQIAEIYRALRKGREDSKDIPGAADFYYGEMEMRRHSQTGPKAERAILWLYWLTSGYALRAWRAFATLAVVVLICAVLFDHGGLKDPDNSPLVRMAAFGGSPHVAAVLVAPQPKTVADRRKLEKAIDELELRINNIAPNGTVRFVRAPADAPDFLDAATFSPGTATALPGAAPDQPLTQWAALLRIGLRVLGPVLIGLALLSIRGRVKR